MKDKPNFYAIVPASVRYDNRLTNGSKLLYGEITALSSKEGYCWATNSYFANLYEVSNSTISVWISSLEKNGHIKRFIKYKKGSREIEGRYLSISNEGIANNLNTPMVNNLKDSTTSISTTSINTSNKTVVEKLDIEYSEIVEYLNLKTGKQYRASTKKTQALIRARVNEGFNVDDFKAVIDKKVKDNHAGYFKDLYLRPETLFGTKFEGYLNQKVNRSIMDIGYNPEVDSF